MADEKRVVLVKPGDILLIGNARTVIRDLEDDVVAAMSDWFDKQGITVAVFEADISIDLATSKRVSDA